MTDNGKNLVIFDWDGVIADSAPFYFDVYRKICDHFGKVFPIATVEAFREWYDSAWENNFIDLGFPREMIPEILAYEGTLVDYGGIALFDGLEAGLRELSRDFHLAVASTTHSTFIRAKVDARGLGGLFTLISGGEDGLSEKRSKIAKVLDHFGLPPTRALMVGDTVMDIVSARALGVRCIAVAYGWNTRQRLDMASPYRIVDAPGDLLPAVRSAFPL